MRALLRLALTLATSVLLVLSLPLPESWAASLPAVSLTVEHAAPRQMEETTEKAVARDYAAAWQAMAEALEENRADLLSANFVGTANNKLTATIHEQSRAGLRQHIVDQGHTVDAVLYSPEGSAIELHDTAHLQLQIMDGTKVVHSENVTLHYVALLTAAENSWKVRVLQAVPAP